ncbi:diguanylate cyclase (GGDEF) domain-containing protein [Abditibacterium utsteinense]|uniref:diguanylate cyclase n=1 Tax=Abditibacterium utsteinense TaxID=1960156 RepID=A0A2S8SWC3_9BACT|nr:GGDEF domain-containing protein [Abditibacterium utsteinense]PQV65087.1 diguanylate cyclase (GGDEF) domain-containing protein [Abditibacterium utsteinense]
MQRNLDRSIAVSDARSGHAAILITASAFLLLLVVATLDARLIDTRFSVLLFYLIPIAWAAWFAGQNPALVVAVFSACMRFGVESVEEINLGSTRPELMWSIASELLFFLVFTGLLLKIHAQLELERSLARSDSLTRLYNARSFEMAVGAERERLARYGRTVSLIYFDLDNFKTVNDQLGHAAGDEVLQTIAKIVKANIRQADVAARLGGDEFALLLPETGYDGARIVLERLQTQVLTAMKERDWPITISFGGVCFYNLPESVALMLKSADAAMYHAKKSGKNRIEMRTFAAE